MPLKPMKTITTENIPILMWVDEIEDGALRQAKNLANLPFAFHHIAIMPDVHEGYGMPIGGVLATKGVVLPNAVGVDIGCGVCAVKSSVKDINKEIIKEILSEIRDVTPLGFHHHKTKQDKNLLPVLNDDYEAILMEKDSPLYQVGTLGGGNHFIEIQQDINGFIWIMLHSGSRNLGKKVADYYNNIAVGLNEKLEPKIPNNWELAYLPLNSDYGKKYLKEMQYCVDFAFANRKLMMDKILEIFTKIFKKITFGEMINIAHNYASSETHFGEKVVVHRKGATKAESGQVGIIPGSQGSNSYIVRGKGNPDSFFSCSHGAGRRMSRNKARNTLDLAKEQEKLDKKGIIHAIRTKNDLDEASGAYKNIKTVMELQSDLVSIEEELKPLAVIKG